MDNQMPQEILPTPDFMEMVNRIEGEKDTQKVTQSPTDDVIMVDTPSGPVPLKKASAEGVKQEESSELLPQKQPEEIKLEYRFAGDCAKHVLPVATLTAEIEGKCICFAYCELCKKNIYSEVVPLLGVIPQKRVFKREGKNLA